MSRMAKTMSGGFFAMSLACGVAAQTVPTVSDAELALGGVALGATEAQVVARRGKPAAKVGNGEGIELRYAGLSVYVGVLDDPDDAGDKALRVYGIASRSRRFCTPSGICPGQSIDAMFEKYGSVAPNRREGGGYFEYAGEASPCWLQFSAAQRRIRTIRVACQP